MGKDSDTRQISRFILLHKGGRRPQMSDLKIVERAPERDLQSVIKIMEKSGVNLPVIL